MSFYRIEDKTLYFNEGFNEPINDFNWPNSINEIKFGYHFNQSLENINWPKSINCIIFGADFNQPIDKIKWPESLKILKFAFRFTNSFDNLPNGLEELVVYKIKTPLLNLPSSLKKLSIHWTSDDIISQCKIPFGCEVIDNINVKRFSWALSRGIFPSLQYDS